MKKFVKKVINYFKGKSTFLKKVIVELVAILLSIISFTFIMLIVGGIISFILKFLNWISDTQVNSVITLLLIILSSYVALMTYRDRKNYKGQNKIGYCIIPKSMDDSGNLKIKLQISSNHFFIYIKYIQIYYSTGAYLYSFYEDFYSKIDEKNNFTYLISIEKLLSPNSTFEQEFDIIPFCPDNKMHFKLIYECIDKKIFLEDTAINTLPSIEVIEKSFKNEPHTNIQ